MEKKEEQIKKKRKPKKNYWPLNSYPLQLTTFHFIFIYIALCVFGTFYVFFGLNNSFGWQPPFLVTNSGWQPLTVFHYFRLGVCPIWKVSEHLLIGWARPYLQPCWRVTSAWANNNHYQFIFISPLYHW